MEDLPNEINKNSDDISELHDEFSSFLEVTLETDSLNSPLLIDSNELHSGVQLQQQPMFQDNSNSQMSEDPLLVELPYTEIEQKFNCSVCNTIFDSREQVHHHIKSSYESGIICSTCKITFKLTEINDYHLHLKSHAKRGRPPKNGFNSEAEYKPHICEACGKTFKTKQQLTNHNVVHLEVKQFPCDICNKSFKLKHQLKIHTKVHEGIKPFMCLLCGKAFKLKQQLQNHSKTHSNDRPYSCLFCDKTFKIKQQLEIHTRVHTDIRPFNCELCPKAFKLKQQLQVHMRVHTDERPYSCNQCDESYKFLQQLQQHLKKHDTMIQDMKTTEFVCVGVDNKNDYGQSQSEEVSIPIHDDVLQRYKVGTVGSNHLIKNDLEVNVNYENTETLTTITKDEEIIDGRVPVPINENLLHQEGKLVCDEVQLISELLIK